MRLGWIFHSKESRNKVAAMCGVFFWGSDYVKPHRFDKPMGFSTHAAIDKIRVREGTASRCLHARYLDAKILQTGLSTLLPKLK